MEKIKTFVFSTDGDYAMINGCRAYDTRQQFEDAQEIMSVYDDGASHFLMEATDENFDAVATHHPQLADEIDSLKLLKNTFELA